MSCNSSFTSNTNHHLIYFNCYFLLSLKVKHFAGYSPSEHEHKRPQKKIRDKREKKRMSWPAALLLCMYAWNHARAGDGLYLGLGAHSQTTCQVLDEAGRHAIVIRLRGRCCAPGGLNGVLQTLWQGGWERTFTHHLSLKLHFTLHTMFHLHKFIFVIICNCLCNITSLTIPGLFVFMLCYSLNQCTWVN